MSFLSASVFTDNPNHLAEAYRGPSLPTTWEERLSKDGWYRLFLPHALNGFQLKLSEGLEFLVETAAVQGSLGWRVNLGAGAGFFAGSMPLATAKEVFGKPQSLISGSGAVSGLAQRVSGGFKLSGMWMHCTGALHATAFTFNARTDDKRVRTFIVMPEKVVIQRHWPYWALKATETYPVTVSQAFVPEEFVFEIGAINQFPDYALYNLDFMVFARACMAASFAGMALCVSRHALQEFSSPKFSAVRAGAEALKKKAITLREILFLEAKKSEACDKTCNEILLRQFLNPVMCEITETSWQMFKEGGMELCREDSLTHQALKDFWLAGRHFLNR